jgi:hypothetical protein
MGLETAGAPAWTQCKAALDISDVLSWSVTVFINSAARALYRSGCYVKHLQILHFVTLHSNKSAHKFEYDTGCAVLQLFR